MRIVVTGATGNIGTAVLRRLSDDDHELVGLARRVPDGPVARDQPVVWHSIDLAGDTANKLADASRARTRSSTWRGAFSPPTTWSICASSAWVAPAGS